MPKIVILHLKTKCNTMDFNLKGHAAMFGANTMWGLMSPVSKIIMASGAVTPWVVLLFIFIQKRMSIQHLTFNI